VILRKPYKFLIKHFRLIHLILFLSSFYLVRKTNIILSFFNEYIESTSLVSVVNLKNNLLNASMFIISIAIILILLVVFTILKRKEKPTRFYLINIISYIFILLFYIYLYNTCPTLEQGIADVRVIKAIDDISLIIFLIQIISTLFFLSRGLGFDIKKFNFSKDLEIETSDSDNEEVEIELDVDTNKLKRNVKRNLRYIKYIYKENRLTINITIVLLIIGFSSLFYYITNVVNKVYKENESFNIDGFKVTISDSYITDEKYDGTKITKNKLIIIKLDLLSLGKESKEFNDSKITLFVNKIPFNSTNTYSKDLIDIGTTYTKKNISNENTESYILVYEVPLSSNEKEIQLVYNYGNNKTINVEIKPKEFTGSREEKTTELTKTIEINNNLVSNTKLTISSYELEEKYKLNYLYKAYDGAYYASYEYLMPGYIDNYDKVLLKLSADFESSKITFDKFIDYFGTIEYKINNETKTMKTQIENVKPKKATSSGIYYFSVYKEIKDADEIRLIFKIRGNEYIYILK
jgi:hypothetical protein